MASFDQPTWRSAVLFGVAALLVIVTVPYFVPVAPSVSDSYIFGYNNRVGTALFLLLAAVGAWWTRRSSLPASDADPKTMRGWVLWVCVALGVVECAAIWRWLAASSGFAESTYFIQRLNLMTAGRVPFRDFEFAYGPGLLYGPWWTARLLHISVACGYYAFWTVCVGLGTWMTWASLRLAADERQDRTAIFVFLFALMTVGTLTSGLNYASIRYVPPVYFAAAVYRLRLRRRAGLACVAVVAGTLILLLITPEMAIAFAMSSAVWLALNWGGERDVRAWALMVAAIGVMSALASRAGWFATLHAFSTGGNSFPMYVSLTIILFFAALWLGLREAGQRITAGDPESVYVYWILLGVVLTPAALGRCDMGHVFTNALGVLLAVGLLLSGSLRARRWVRVGGVAYLLLILLPSLRVEYVPITARAAAGSNSSVMQRYARWALGSEGAAHAREAALPVKLDLVPGEKVLAPFSFAPDGAGAYASGEVEYGYYDALTNVLTREQVQRKIEEMRSNPDAMLLLPRQWVSHCVRTADNARALLSGLHGVPYIKEPVHEMDLYMPVCEYIRGSYRYVPARSAQELGEWDLWARVR